MDTITTILRLIKEKGLNVSLISRQTGIPVQRLHKHVTGPYKPKTDDAEKLKLWAKENLEEIKKLQPLELNDPGSIYEKNLLPLLVELMKRQNHILERQVNNVEIKVERIDTNLNDAVGRVASLKYDVFSGRQVMLQSLARLEGKAPDALVKEADNITLELLKAQSKQSKSAEKGK